MEGTSTSGSTEHTENNISILIPPACNHLEPALPIDPPGADLHHKSIEA